MMPNIKIAPSAKAQDALIYLVIGIVLLILYGLYKAGKVVSDTVETAKDAVTKPIYTTETPFGKVEIPAGLLSLMPALKANFATLEKANAYTKKAKATVASALSYSKTKDSAFSPLYWKSFGAKPVKQLTAADKADMLSKVYNSVGLITDDPATLYRTFLRLQYKTQVSCLADAFQTKYGKNMFAWLADKMDTSYQVATLASIVTYVSNLKTGV